uniref:hypothetical protein n=1 Tax=Castellaniella defragrans TaxID=75697 RepID=UPI00333E80E8
MLDAADRVDISTWLPFGEQLRVLLSGDHISTGDLAVLARSKGLFVVGLDRTRLIQFLSTTLVQPFEIGKLLDDSASREAKPKAQPQKVTLTAKDANWQAAVERIQGDLANIVSTARIPGVSFTREPSIQRIGRNHRVISYEIIREDYSRDLLHRELSFKADIAIRQNEGALVLDVISTHTAKETDLINNQIINHITSELKAAGISKDDAPSKIRLGSFDGNNHVTFLLRLAGPDTVGKEPGRIVDLTIKPNSARAGADLPPELSLLEGSIRNMRMDGDTLNEISLIANEQYHGLFLMTRVLVDHQFDLEGVRGKCSVVYYFQISRGSEDLAIAPFLFGVESIVVAGARKSEQKAKARKVLNSAILAAVDRHFNALRSL